MCIRCTKPWVSPMNSPVRLGVSPATISTPTGVFSQRFEALFPCTGTLGCGSVLSPVVLPSLSACECGTAWSTSCHLARVLSSRLPVSAPPTVWMNVSSLSPWLSGFHTVQFSVSFGCFLYLNWLLSLFWLCEEAQCVYLRLHLGWESGTVTVF